MEAKVDNVPINLLGSPILALSKHGSSDSVETYPQKKEPLSLLRDSSCSSMPQSFQDASGKFFPPLREIYVKQRPENDRQNIKNHSATCSRRSSDSASSESSYPSESDDEDGPHLLRWGSLWSGEEEEHISMVQVEDDDTIESTPYVNDFLTSVNKKTSPPTKSGEVFVEKKPLSPLKSCKESPKSIFSFIDFSFLQVGRKKSHREKSDKDLQVPEIMACSFDLVDDNSAHEQEL